MPPTIEDIQNRLNLLYRSGEGSKEYQEHLEMIKGMGYKVLRNSKGQHKVDGYVLRFRRRVRSDF